ncbi:Hypothetical predicted protein [Paramuricea clavata]|uniref:Centromere protein U n=1 Tax=Paramuricea clavata TaxID=317549 RepID=A0A6S7KB41_PARCT|nr:Hypothetical predicted protein [Paramuricea clavata]
MSDDGDGDGDVHIPSVSDDDDAPPPATSEKNNVVGAEPSSDIFHDAAAEFDDVRPMAVDDSPVKNELPQHANVEDSLPGGKESVSKTVLDNTLKKSSSRKQQDNHDRDDEDDSDDDLNIFEEKTPLRNKSPPQSVGLKSGLQSKQPRSVATRKRVVFDRRAKENKKPRFDEEEYEAQNFVRLFNADRGRKGGATDVTDLDIVLTNIEEVALEIKCKTDSAVNKKLVREAFIQIRQIFSDTIDIYKEKKYLQSATTKTNSRIKRMRQELLDIQDKRKEGEAKLNKLKSECNTIERRIKSKEEAYNFLTEFEQFQDDLRKSDPDHNSGEEYRGDESLPSLLCEGSGYLSTERQLRNINDKLQLWLDKNNT